MSEKMVKTGDIGEKIFIIRGQKVILDRDLSKLYGVPTKRLNEQVKRNSKRFPPDFLFRLTRAEAERVLVSRSQIATLKRGQNIKHLPYAFTEYGAVMAANILNSPRAVRMSVFVVKAFVRMHKIMSAGAGLAGKLIKLEKILTSRLDAHEKAIFEILQQLVCLLNSEAESPGVEDKSKRVIGFTAKEGSPKYQRRKKRAEYALN